MGYNLNTLKEELVSKNLADDGLVAWGQNVSPLSGMLFGVIGSLVDGAGKPKYTISMAEGTKIVIIPFTNKGIQYSQGQAFDKSQIAMAKVSGGLSIKLKINTTDGRKLTYRIIQGVPEVKEILAKLGLNAK